jgi:hypothetical protein
MYGHHPVDRLSNAQLHSTRCMPDLQTRTPPFHYYYAIPRPDSHSGRPKVQLSSKPLRSKIHVKRKNQSPAPPIQSVIQDRVTHKRSMPKHTHKKEKSQVEPSVSKKEKNPHAVHISQIHRPLFFFKLVRLAHTPHPQERRLGRRNGRGRIAEHAARATDAAAEDRQDAEGDAQDAARAEVRVVAEGGAGARLIPIAAVLKNERC